MRDVFFVQKHIFDMKSKIFYICKFFIRFFETNLHFIKRLNQHFFSQSVHLNISQRFFHRLHEEDTNTSRSMKNASDCLSMKYEFLDFSIMSRRRDS